MSSLSAAGPRNLAVFAPPYEALLPCGNEMVSELAEVESWKGCSLIWQLAANRADNDAAAALSYRSPGLPLFVLLPPPAQIKGILELLPVVRTLRPRLILPFGVVESPPRLRQILASPPRSVPAAVTDHLVSRGVLRHRNTIREFQRILELAPEIHGITELARRMYTSRRTLGRHFSKHDLPVPSHCLHFARLLHVAIRLHSEDVAIFRVANRFGYPDGFTMSNQMKRLTGYRPSEVRELLGWEWITEAWVKQEGLV
jgi:AraC-like DNA-binding protein